MSESAGKRRLLTNAIANWLGFVAQVVVALLLSPILVDGLGARRYGIWSLVESVLAYLLLFDLGVAASVVRYVARFEATRDRDGLNRVFNTSLAIFAAAGLAALAVVLLLAGGVVQRLNIPADLADEGRWMLLVLGLNLAVGLPLGVFSAVLDGLERYPIKTAIRTLALALRSAIFLVIMRSEGGLLELAWAITGCNLLEHLALAAAAWWCLPGLRVSPRWVDRETFRTVRGYSLRAFLSSLAVRVSFQTGPLIIWAYLAPEYITFFVLAARLVEYAKSALRAVTMVLTPAVSALDARGEDDKIRRVFLDGTRYVLWLILPIQAGLLILGGPFLTLWVPKYATASYPTLAILAVPLALALCQSVSARILFGLGRLQWFMRLMIAEAVVNLLLSITLARPLGIEGVAWGMTLPNIVANLGVMAYACRAVDVRAGEYVGRSFLKPCAAAALLAVGWWLACLGRQPATWMELVALGLAGLAGYALLAVGVELGPQAVLDRVRALALSQKVTS